MPPEAAPFAIVPATEDDAPRMGRMMVETWLAAHGDQIPPGQLQRRIAEWTPEVSTSAWARVLREIREGTAPRTFMHLAVGESYEEGLAGLVMAGPARSGPWDDAGEVYSLYVRQAAQRKGIGRGLLARVTADMVAAGVTRVVIRCLDTNEPGRAFYERLGGRHIGDIESEDYGYTNLERIYAWDDCSRLMHKA